MPRIRRWFHVSHDINSDPEVWELTDKFGERAFRIWMEILSIADRYDGLVPGEIKYLSSTLAAKCKSRSRTVEGIIKYAADKEWIVYDPVRRLRNQLKYRPRRETNKTPPGKHYAPPPHSPHTPALPKDKKIPYVRQKTPDAVPGLIAYFNEKCGTTFKANGKSTTGHLKARLRDGFTAEDIKAVIDHKAEEWGSDAKMVKFLRPITLFGPEKFEGYLQEARRGRPREDPNP